MARCHCNTISCGSCISLLLLLVVAVAADVQTHINIGFRPADTTVALNGQVAARYQPGAPNLPKIDQYFMWLEFFLTLTAGFGSTPSQAFFASVNNSNAAVETSSVDSITASGTLTPTSDATVRVRMVCNQTGQDVVTLQLDLDGFDSIYVQFVKLCVVNGTDAHGVFNVATKDWTHTIEEGDVVAGGATLPLWTGDDSLGPGHFMLFNQSIHSQTFFLWLYRGVQPYTIVADESDLDRVAVSLSSTSGVATRQTPGGWTSNFTVTFNCLGTGWFGFVSVELRIDPYNPVAIGFFVDCIGSPTPPPLSPSGGWSSVSIVFFTLFMFVACGCVGGCVFKALKRHVRGLDLLPFIDEFRSLWSRLNGGSAGSSGAGTYQVFQSSVGPQEELKTNATTSSNPYTSYQTL